MITLISLKNDFHNTYHQAFVFDGAIWTPSKITKIRKTLCPFRNCLCSGLLGTRGHQSWRHEWGYDHTGSDHPYGTIVWHLLGSKPNYTLPER